MKKLDLTNQTFNSLEVLYPGEPIIGPTGRKYTTWVCKCECGNITTVRTDYLRNGHTKTCGCACGRIDLIGKTFGKLEVKKKLPGGKHLCQCECGNLIEVITYNLTNGNTQSCGCLKSKGELKINQLLQELDYNYCSQYSFSDLKSPKGRTMFFDFAIFDKNNKLICLLEYDGPQHYYGWGGNKNNLEYIQEYDKIKNDYCKKRGIVLKRIKFSLYEKLNKEVLEGIIKESAEAPAIAEAAGKAYTNVDKIYMYGGDTSKLTGDIINNISQVSEGLSESLGIDLKSVLAGFLGGQLGTSKDVTVNVGE